MAYETLLLKKEGRVAVLTLNRPQKFNLVAEDMLLELEQAQNEIEKMDDLGAVVLHGAGDHFCAGMNLKTLLNVDSAWVRKHLPWLQSVYSRWEELPVPVIAAVHGLCLGSAVEMILGCDIRIAATNAHLAIPEVKYGLAPDMGGTTRLTKLIGIGQAKRMIIGCEEIDAAEAKAIGMVDIVVEPEQLMERAMELANRIAGFPPVAVNLAKKGINLAQESSRMASLMFEQAQSIYCCGTEDQTEAVTAFFEKRKPVFKGK
ncbi:MAG: enoyl-CoA hydratase/isomerase family protein [Solirubrobacterales bacterium]